jgi:nucleolar pre-ribosomal-associated protein 1
MVLRARSPSPHVQEAAASLAATMLARSILFEHDTSEPVAWLDALPSLQRSPKARAPDGTFLVDELSCVASFLDECASRCLKTPYHYLESILDLCYNPEPGLRASESSLRSRPPQFAPSPLLGTVFEQFAAKQNKQLFSASETLAIVTYLRKVLVSLIGKQPDVACTGRVLDAFRTLIRQTRVPANASSIASGLGRELRFVNHIVSQLSAEEGSPVSDSTHSNRDAVTSFLDAIESTDAGE